MILSKIIRFFQINNLYDRKTAIALSGGADSVSLLFALCALREKLSLSLSIIHVNYHLRGSESDGDQLFVQNLASRLSVPCSVYSADLSCSAAGIEESARKIRHDIFRKVIDSGDADCVAIGHTLEDQAETVLFRLSRGCSLVGASAMEAVRSDGVIRPLLALSRSECRQYLVSIGESWREDSSNASDQYMRNRIRHRVIPELSEINSGAVRHLAEFAEHARRVNAELAALGFERLFQRGLRVFDRMIHFERKGGLSESELSAVVSLLSERGCPLSLFHSELLRCVDGRSGKTELLPKGWRLYLSWKRVICFHESADPFSASSYESSLYRFDAADDLSVRTLFEDDQCEVRGQWVSVQKYLAKIGVPSRERLNLPVLPLFEKRVALPEFL